MNNVELKEMLKEALELMYEKQRAEYESIVDVFIKKYEVLLNIIDSQGEVTSADVTGIKTCTRAYAETSSNYRQEFLNALGAVEKYVRG